MNPAVLCLDVWQMLGACAVRCSWHVLSHYRGSPLPTRRPGRFGKSLFGAGNECLDSNRCLDSKKFTFFKRSKEYLASVYSKLKFLKSLVSWFLVKFVKFGKGMKFSFVSHSKSRKALSCALRITPATPWTPPVPRASYVCCPCIWTTCCSQPWRPEPGSISILTDFSLVYRNSKYTNIFNIEYLIYIYIYM